ncbi:uncharacterized [Tachysurus ichikawai]
MAAMMDVYILPSNFSNMKLFRERQRLSNRKFLPALEHTDITGGIPRSNLSLRDDRELDAQTTLGVTSVSSRYSTCKPSSENLHLPADFHKASQILPGEQNIKCSNVYNVLVT